MVDKDTNVPNKMVYISQERVIELLTMVLDYWNVGYAIDSMNEIPSADVVEVVHCKDCYAYQRDPDSAKAAGLNPAEYCALLRCEFGPGGFCSYGRRADNG